MMVKAVSLILMMVAVALLLALFRHLSWLRPPSVDHCEDVCDAAVVLSLRSTDIEPVGGGGRLSAQLVRDVVLDVVMEGNGSEDVHVAVNGALGEARVADPSIALPAGRRLPHGMMEVHDHRGKSQLTYVASALAVLNVSKAASSDRMLRYQGRCKACPEFGICSVCLGCAVAGIHRHGLCYVVREHGVLRACQQIWFPQAERECRGVREDNLA